MIQGQPREKYHITSGKRGCWFEMKRLQSEWSSKQSDTCGFLRKFERIRKVNCTACLEKSESILGQPEQINAVAGDPNAWQLLTVFGYLYESALSQAIWRNQYYLDWSNLKESTLCQAFSTNKHSLRQSKIRLAAACAARSVLHWMV